MSACLTYLFMTIVSLGIVYAGYLVALRSGTCFRLNRFYLLSGLFAAFLLPLAGLMGWLPDIAATLFTRGQPSDVLFFGMIDMQVLEAFEVTSVPDTGFVVSDLLWMTYLLVSVGLLIRFMMRLYGMWRLMRKAETDARSGYSVCWVPDEVSPFSFFKTIFLSREVRNDDQWEEIMRHEAVHIREGHSFDIIVLHGLKVFFWFNPFLYLVDRSLRESHEFQADAQVLRDGLDMDAYQTLLLRQLGSSRALVLSNNFNYTLIKRRLSMFTRKSSRWARLRSIMMLPLALSVVCLYTSSSSAREVTSVEQMSETIQELVTQPPTQNSGKDAPLLWVESQPEFPGGRTQMSEFLMKNLKYPQTAKDNNIKGTVVLSYIVDKDGTIANVTVLRSLDPDCDAEAIRVVSLMPKWRPGMQNGEAVRVQYQLPIRFSLPSSTRPQTGTQPASTTGSKTPTPDSRGVYQWVETPPQFPGGASKMYEFLNKNLRYPQTARDNNIQGTVVLQFVVEPDGAITNLSVLRSISPDCDDEAIRVVHLMPKWTPGKQKGETVRVQFVLPVKFTIK